MAEVDKEGRAERLEKVKRLYAEIGIEKEDFLALGFSEKQWYSWHSSEGSSPHVDYAVKVFREFDISPAFVWFDIGPPRLSDIVAHYEERSQTRSGIMEYMLSGSFEADLKSWAELSEKVGVIYDMLKREGRL